MNHGTLIIGGGILLFIWFSTILIQMFTQKLKGEKYRQGFNNLISPPFGLTSIVYIFIFWNNILEEYEKDIFKEISKNYNIEKINKIFIENDLKLKNVEEHYKLIRHIFICEECSKENYFIDKENRIYSDSLNVKFKKFNNKKWETKKIYQELIKYKEEVK